MAQTFDTDYRIKRANIVAHEITQRIDLSKNKNVLEFGCGTGLVTVNLIENMNNLSLIDSSEGMLHQLKVKLSTMHANNKINLYNDLFDNNLLANTYDLIYTSMVLHHIKNIDLYGNRFNELLSVNGTLCIIDLLPVAKEYHINEPEFDGYHGFDPAWLIKQLENQGFEKELCDVIYNDSKSINNKIIDYSLFLLIMKKK
jgi:Methylase involved in ubiquinone/menaquinone biosynthesis